MFRASVSYPYLSDLFVVERDNPDQPRLTLKQRFNFCINTINMATRHAQGAKPECLRLYELMIETVTDHDATIVIQPHSTTFTLPPQIARDRITENSGYSFDDLFITTTDTVPSEKSTVQLLGLLFFKLFQPLIYGEHLRTFPSLDKRSHDRLIEILSQMTHPDPDTRSTLADALESLKSLNSSYIGIHRPPSQKLITDIENQQKLEAYFRAKARNLETRQLTNYDNLKIEVALEDIQFESSASTATISTPSRFTFFSKEITHVGHHNTSHHSSAAAAAQQANYDGDPTMDLYQNV